MTEVANIAKPTAILGYWAIRGLAGPCRLLFEFAGAYAVAVWLTESKPFF